MREIIEKYGLTGLTEISSAELEQREKEVLSLAQQLIDDSDWQSLSSLVESIPDSDFLVTASNTLQELYERLSAKTIKHDPSFFIGDEKDILAFEVAAAVVRKIGHNPDLTPYLLDIIQKQRMPQVARRGVFAKYHPDADGMDEVRDWYFYQAVVDGLAARGGEGSVQAISQAIKAVDAQVAEVNRGQESPSIEEEKFSRRESLNFLNSGLSHFGQTGKHAESFKSHAITVLGDTKSPEAEAVIMELLKSEGNRSYLYIPEAVAAMEKLDPKIFAGVENLLESRDINLADYVKHQQINLLAVNLPERRAKALRFLSSLGKFEPTPEIHWRVDRTMDEYNRRFGIDLEKFLTARAQLFSRKQFMLEIGFGSGQAKKDRFQDALTEHYEDFGLADKIYYSPVTAIKNLIDLGIDLTAEEKDVFADFIYKTIAIKQGQAGLDTFEYDDLNMRMLADDANNLKVILLNIGSRLAATDVVPSTISGRTPEGAVFYPNKIKVKEQSEVFQRVKKMFEQNPEKFLPRELDKRDVYEYLPVFAPNVILGDLQDIDRLRSDQVDVEIASRSTVYAKGEDYINFLGKLEKVLAPGGVAVDDSIRDNDGWRYRLPEILEFKQRASAELEILVVLGKPFPGEDSIQEQNVPLAMLITKQGSSAGLAKDSVINGSEVLTLEELLIRKEYLVFRGISDNSAQIENGLSEIA